MEEVCHDIVLFANEQLQSLEAKLCWAHSFVDAHLCEGAEDLLHKEDRHTAIEGAEALLAVELLEAVEKTAVEHQLASPTVELLATLHGVQRVEEQ